jgi:hypothetical protein
MTGLNQALGSTTEDRVLKLAPDKARPSAWGDHEGKGAESWCRVPESLLSGDQRPGGVPPRLLSTEFFCDRVPGPHSKMKMKKEKSKNHLNKNQISRGSKTRSRSPSAVLHSHDQPEPVESKLEVHHGHYLLSTASEPACSNDQFVSKGVEKRTLAGLKAHFQRFRVRAYQRISFGAILPLGGALAT